MKLAEQYEIDEKYDEAYAEYKKELPHRAGDVELLTKLAHLALILDKKDEAKAYYDIDRSKLEGLNIGAKFDANGALTNYEEVLARIEEDMSKATDEYNKAIAA